MPFIVDRNGYPIPALKFSSTEAIVVSNVSAQSTANTTKDRVVRIISDIDFYIEQGGTDPTATSNSPLVAAGSELILVVAKNTKLALLRVGANNGSAWITDLD